MHLRVSDVAWESWEGIIKYYAENYGAQAIRNLTDSFEERSHSIQQFPESGALEPFRQYAISIDTGTSSGGAAQCHRGCHWAEDGVAARLRLPGAGYLQ